MLAIPLRETDYSVHTNNRTGEDVQRSLKTNVMHLPFTAIGFGLTNMLKGIRTKDQDTAVGRAKARDASRGHSTGLERQTKEKINGIGKGEVTVRPLRLDPKKRVSGCEHSNFSGLKDLEAIFHIASEIFENGDKLQDHTYRIALVACVTKRGLGFRAGTLVTYEREK